MNTKYPVTNNTAMPIYVGALMIPPGETRHFDLEQLPPEHRPVAAVEAVQQDADPLLAVLDATVAAVVIGLPALNDDELARLEVLEDEGKARKGVLEAIAAEKLARAEKALAGTGGAGGEGGEG